MLTKEERDKVVKEGFPDIVEGYARPGDVPTDFPHDVEFPQMIANDQVINTLMNLILRQLLSNDKLAREDVDQIIEARQLEHTFTIKGDASGSTTFNNSSDISVSVTVKSFTKGMIMMWYGSSNAVPDGWAICNGQNGTPDLRNRFVVGVGSKSLGATGGEENHTLTMNEIPSHQHVVPYGERTVKASFPWGSYGSGLQGSNSTDYDNLWPYTSYAGGGGAHNNMPPYMALYYIMKL